MRILYIYNDYRRRRKIYGDIMSELGHNVRFLNIVHKRELNTIKVKHIQKSKQDIIFIRTPYYVSHSMSNETINYIKSKKIPLVIYDTINPSLTYEQQLSTWKKIDVSFVISKEFCDFLNKNGINAHHIPTAFHPSQYYKSVSSTKLYDVSFMGSALKKGEPKRCKYLQSLINQNYKVGIYGIRFDKKIKKSLVKSFRTHEEQRRVYGKTKVNLDMPFIDGCDFYKNKYHFKNRFFEIPATCNFMLALRNNEFLNIFPEDTVGYYDDSKESLKENVRKYLKDKEIRKKMAKKAYKLVYEKHTFVHRFKKMFKILKETL